jgi:hypothetical protein
MAEPNTKACRSRAPDVRKAPLSEATRWGETRAIIVRQLGNPR